MHIQVEEQVIRISVIHLEGRVDAFNSPDLRHSLGRLLDSGVSQLIIDLSQVTFLDSAALAVLVNTLKRARLAGGDVRLVWPEAESAQRVIHLTKFDRLFVIADTVDVARREFGSIS